MLSQLGCLVDVQQDVYCQMVCLQARGIFQMHLTFVRLIYRTLDHKYIGYCDDQMGGVAPISKPGVKYQMQNSLIADESEYVEAEESFPIDTQSSQISVQQAQYGNQCKEVLEQDMPKSPHKFIAAIEFRVQSQKNIGRGSGFMISRNLLLTCAHVVYSKKFNKPCCDFKVYLAQHGPLQRYYKAKILFFPTAYINSKNPFNDFAILKLEEQIKDDDFIPLCPSGMKILDKEAPFQACIYGYPISKYRESQVNQWGFKGSCKQMILQVREQNGQLLHLLPTQVGHSGSPIIIKDKNGNLVIIAIHIGEVIKKSTNTSRNAARLITHDVINIIRRQAEKAKAQMLPIQEQLELDVYQQLIILKEKFKQTQNTLKRTKNKLVIIQNKLENTLVQLKNNQQQKQSLEEKSAILSKRLEQKSMQFETYRSQKQSKIQDLESELRQLKDNKQHLEKAHLSLIKKIQPMKVNQSRIGKTYSQAQIKAEQYLEKGNKYQANQDHANAIEYYKLAIEFNSSLWLAYYNLGVVLFDIGQVEKAIDYYRGAIKENPKAAQAYFNLGVALESTNKVAEAIIHFQQAVRLNPDDPLFHYGLGNIQPGTKESIECYKKAINLKGDYSQAYYNLATKYLSIQEFELAKENFMKTIKYNHKDLQAYQGLYALNHNKESLQQIISLLQDILKKDPNLVYAKRYLYKFRKLL